MQRRFPFLVAVVAGILLFVGIVSLLDKRSFDSSLAGKNRASESSRPSHEDPVNNAAQPENEAALNAPLAATNVSSSAVHPLPSNISPADFRLPTADLTLTRDPTFGTPRFVGKRSGFLSPPAPGAVPEAVLRAFLEANGRTFTLHASDVLDPANAEKTRDVVTPHNGMRSVTWRQQHGGLEIFGAHLALNLTRDNQIINVQSRALHVPSLRFHDEVKVTAEEAEAIAGGINHGKHGRHGKELPPPAAIWYLLDMITVVKAWDIFIEQKATEGTKETHRVIVRADTGEVVEDINLTWSLEPVMFQVYTNDSPSAFSPGMDEPTNFIPSVVTQSVFSITVLSTNASPQGWMPDGTNSSLGNNIDAYTDLLDDNQVDPGDRIAGPLYRDFSGLPNNSTSAVVQAFYWGNMFHDRLYQLGFDEASGNFQQDNFGRGGRDADRLRVEVWNGAYQTPYGQFAQANMTVLNDGNPPRMQLYLWNRAADEFFQPAFARHARQCAGC
jgi:extracellular elastinolytic metalloproteinase